MHSPIQLLHVSFSHLRATNIKVVGRRSLETLDLPCFLFQRLDDAQATAFFICPLRLNLHQGGEQQLAALPAKQACLLFLVSTISFQPDATLTQKAQ